MKRSFDRRSRVVAALAAAASAALALGQTSPRPFVVDPAQNAPPVNAAPATGQTAPNNAAAQNDAPSRNDPSANNNNGRSPNGNGGRAANGRAAETQAIIIRGAPATKPAPQLSLKFKDASVDTVIDYLSQTGGYQFIKESPVDGRVTITSATPVTPPQALTLLNAALKHLGLTTVEQDNKLVKIMTVDKALKSNVPVHFGADPNEIANTDEIITQVIPIKSIDAVKLKQELQGMTSSTSDFTADAGSNSLIMTDASANIKRIVKIVSQLDQQITQTTAIRIWQLRFADATSAAKLITSLFNPTDQNNTQNTPGGGPGRFFRQMMMRGGGPGGAGAEANGSSTHNVKVTAVADDRTNTLVVTAAPDSLTLIEKIIDKLDSDPTATSQVRIFHLTYADSASAAKLIAAVFPDPNQQNNNNQGGRGGRFPFFGQPQQDNTNAKVGHVTATSDDRTNTLVVTAPIESMGIISGILKELDSNQTTESAFFIYKLRNAQAINLQSVLNSMFGNTTGGVGNTTNNNNNTNRNTSSFSSGFGSSGVGGRGGGSGLGGGFGGSGFGTNTNTGNGFNNNNNRNTSGIGGLSGASNRAIGELAGNVYVVADTDTNSLLVSTASKYQAQVKKIIEELDRPVPQVLIKVLVAEVSHDNTSDFGLDFSVLDQRPSGHGVVAAQTNGNAASYVANGGLAVSLMETNLNVTLHALATEGKLDVLSRPYILASDNQPANITIGQEVPFITDTQINQLGNQINTITYQPVGIIVNVTPHINPDGLVILDVAPQISQLTGTTVPIGNGISAPVIDNRSASSRVEIINGNTIVIGGMMQDQKTTTINKIPLLGDIPVLGELFKRSQISRSKTELLIFLTPHVAQRPETLKAMSADEVNGTRLTKHAVEEGAYKEHMQGMQRGATPHEVTTRPAAVDIATPPSTQPFHGITIGEPAAGRGGNSTEPNR